MGRVEREGGNGIERWEIDRFGESGAVDVQYGETEVDRDAFIEVMDRVVEDADSSARNRNRIVGSPGPSVVEWALGSSTADGSI